MPILNHANAGNHYVARKQDDGTYQVYVQTLLVNEETFGTPKDDQATAIAVAAHMNAAERKKHGAI